jgi:2-oxoglutarate ferredoxin oxidoreductase subunit alpha
MPGNLGEILAGFKRILVPELNLGQLRSLLRARYLVDAVGFTRMQAKPLVVSDLLAEIRRQVEEV